MNLIIKRRSFLVGAISLLAAPAIVRAENIMRCNPFLGMEFPDEVAILNYQGKLIASAAFSSFPDRIVLAKDYFPIDMNKNRMGGVLVHPMQVRRMTGEKAASLGFRFDPPSQRRIVNVTRDRLEDVNYQPDAPYEILDVQR